MRAGWREEFLAKRLMERYQSQDTVSSAALHTLFNLFGLQLSSIQIGNCTCLFYSPREIQSRN